jgi:ribokinase
VTAPRIVVVGSTMIDLVAYADRLPGDGETVVGTSYETGFGGKGANQAVMAARFGAEVAVVNAVGDDDHGTSYLERFQAEGIDTSFMRRVPGSSGVAPIWVDAGGTNRIIIIPGANREVRPEVAVEAVESFRPDVVIGQFEIPQTTTAAGFAAARRIGAITVLNPAPAAAVEPELVAVTDWLVPNETEFGLIAGRPLGGSRGAESAAVAELAGRLGVSIVVTLGERGAFLLPRDGEGSWVDAPRVRPVDTTGAGDAFVGAFAVGLATGRSPADAVRLGCVAAADSVTRRGTQASYPDRAAAAAMLRPHVDRGGSRMSDPERDDPRRPHRFRVADDGIAAVMSGSGFGETIQDRLIGGTAASRRALVCGLPGCGRTRDDAIHAPPEDADPS